MLLPAKVYFEPEQMAVTDRDDAVFLNCSAIRGHRVWKEVHRAWQPSQLACCDY